MLTNRSRSLIPLAATVFIVWLCGNAAAAASSYDENVYSQSGLEATTSPNDPRNIPGFPINIGGGGNSNGGGGWLRIWTPFGWITIGGGGDNHGGGGHGGFQPFLPPPIPPKPKPLPQPSNPTPFIPVTPNPSIPTPQHPSNPVTPNPSNPVTPKPSKPTPCNPVTPNPSNPTPPKPSNPPSRPSNPKIPPWLAPYIGSDGRLHQPPSPPPVTPKWLAPYIGSDGRLHLPDRPSQPIPKWLAPYIGKPPQGSTPVNSMGGTLSEANAVETSKTPSEERHHYYQCWSALEKVDKCVNEILTAFSSRKFQVLGSACCSAIENMDKDCHARTIGNFHDHFFSASVHSHCSAN